MHTNGTSMPISSLIDRSLLARNLLLVTCFGALTALGAQTSIRLPFTPVPVTLQVFFVILSGLMLGSRLAAMSQVTYLMMGLAGLPVFAEVKAGPLAFACPSGGYLFGFVAGAYFVGLLREKAWGNWLNGTLSVCAGIAVIYAFGTLHLAFITLGGDIARAVALGVVPFIGVDTVKAILALGAAGSLDRLGGRSS